MISEEKLILCDLLTLSSKKDDKKFYVAIIYSNLTQDIEKVFITKAVFDFLSDNINVDLKEYFYRTYNVYTKKFNLKYYNNL